MKDFTKFGTVKYKNQYIAAENAETKLAAPENVSSTTLPTSPVISAANPAIINNKWLTKNRFWNFVFWIGMSVGFSITFAISGINDPSGEFSYWSTVMFWLTLIGVPTLVRFGSKTTLVKDNIFLDIEGRELNLPNGFLTIITTIALTAFTGALLDKTFANTANNASLFLLISIFFLIPTLFFIFKNCPISILFNRKLWRFEAYTDSQQKKSDDSRYYSPAYSFYASNIHHSTRK